MRICVISDLHYKYLKPSAEDAENSSYTLEFLDQAKAKYDLIVLCGDIFDLWYDWQYTIIKQYFPLLVKLHELKESGCRIVYIAGNHDFWFGDFFPEYMGIELYDENFEIEANGKKLFFCHGDTHTVNDIRYHLFRRFIRLPLMKRIFGFLHPDLALRLGSKLSRSSRDRKDPAHLRLKKNAGLMNYASKIIRSGYADYVIMGHSHNPIIKPIEHGFYANSGDWISHHSYLEIDAGGISLKYYKKQGE